MMNGVIDVSPSSFACTLTLITATHAVWEYEKVCIVKLCGTDNPAAADSLKKIIEIFF